VKMHIDLGKCGGCGMCEFIAEDVFLVGDDGQGHVLVEDVPEVRRAQMKEAVAQCPTEALSIQH